MCIYILMMMVVVVGTTGIVQAWKIATTTLAVLNLCTLVDRHPPTLLVLLNTRHDAGETEAGVREVLDDALEEGQHLRVGLVAVQDALGSQLDPSRPPPGA